MDTNATNIIKVHHKKDYVNTFVDSCEFVD